MTHIQFFFDAGLWWLFTLLSFACFGLAWFVYRRTTPAIVETLRWSLTVIRTVGLICLLIALFEPIVRWVQSDVVKPPVLIAIDNSASMSMKDGGASRKEATLKALTRIMDILPDAPMVSFSDVTSDIPSTDSLLLNGTRTDIEQLVRSVANRQGMSRPGVVVVVTDGNVNSGNSPLFAAEQSGLGWYTIGIGDTAQPNDIALQTIIVPTLCVVDQATNVSVPIQTFGHKSVPIVVGLYEEGSMIASDTITPTADRDRSMAHFIWSPKRSGHRKLTARLLNSVKETITANNQVQELVEVRENKSRIAVFAGAPSSDLSFIQSTISSSPTTEVQSYVQKLGATFYNDLPTASDLQSCQSIVLVGFPISSTPSEVMQRIKDACAKGVGLLFIPSRETDYTKLKQLEQYLPFTTVTSRQVENLVTADVSGNATSDPLLKISGTDEDANTWKNLPPIYKTETYVQAATGAETLATIRINNVPLPEPLILRLLTGNVRSIAVLGYGLYRWRLLGTGPSSAKGQDVSDAFSSLITNAISWLAVDENTKRFTVTTTRKFYNTGEVVTFKGSVADNSLIPVDGANVRVAIDGQRGQREFILDGLGGGRYSGNVQGLPPGDYRFKAFATKQSNKLGEDVGRFTIGDLDLEQTGVVQNSSLLTMLAERTGARYGNADEAEQIARAALADKRLRSMAITSEQDKVLWHTPWPLIVCVLAFAVEWVLRKRNGLV